MLNVRNAMYELHVKSQLLLFFKVEFFGGIFVAFITASFILDYSQT